MPGGLSQDGRWLVLEQPAGNPVAPTARLPPARRRHVDHESGGEVDLAGDFEFDAISNDGQRIYLIEYAVRRHYRVRVYDVGARQLDPNISRRQERRLRRDDRPAPVGCRLAGRAVAVQRVRPPGQGAFVHALNLDAAVSRSASTSPVPGMHPTPTRFHWSLALSADGTHLFAANGAMGIVSEIDNDANGVPSVTRTVHIDSTAAAASPFVNNVGAKELGADGAVLSPDGQTLVVTGATGIDLARHRHAARVAAVSSTLEVWSLALSPDGKHALCAERRRTDRRAVDVQPRHGDHVRREWPDSRSG